MDPAMMHNSDYHSRYLSWTVAITHGNLRGLFRIEVDSAV